ncbi:hypothetical protein KA005_00525, partial [bacterium]|nr:hypothetical protein [bacterium]
LGTIDFSRGITVVMRFAPYNGIGAGWISVLGQWKPSTNERCWAFSWGNSTTGNYDAQRLNFGVSADGVFQSNGAAAFPALTNNAWYDVVGIFDNSHVTSVLDGTIIESNAYTGPAINSSIGLTLNHYTGSSEYPGSKFAYIYIFNQPLTLSQVRNIRNNSYGIVEPIRSSAIWSIPAIGVAPTSIFYGPLMGPLGGSI